MSNRGKNFRSTDAVRLTDEATRDLLFKIAQYIERNPLLSFGFEFVEYTVSESTYPATINIPHPLGFIPKDVILTSKTGSGDITFNYTAFTKNTISISATGSCAIRFLVGSFRSER